MAWFPIKLMHFYCALSSFWDAYCVRQSTPNLSGIFNVQTCFQMRILKLCQSVRPYPEKRNHPSFINISPTLVIDTSMEMYLKVLQHGN